jgi:hypothetical protein
MLYILRLTKNYKYPTERIGLLQHIYNQYRTKISLCSRHGIAENRLTCHRTTTFHYVTLRLSPIITTVSDRMKLYNIFFKCKG